MFRKVSILAALCGVISTAAVAQSLPVTTSIMPDQSGNTNGASTSLSLRDFFTISGVSGDIMRFDTTFGMLDVEMLSMAAPNHVQNFKDYASREEYDDTMIHRIAAFNTTGGISIVQGGAYTAEVPAALIPQASPVDLEYEVANARGTLAAARTNDPNSARSQWYFNTTDNSTILGPDDNPPGFTVFGRVMGNGMEVVDQMAEVPAFLFNSPFEEIPLVNYEFPADVTPDNYVKIHSVREIPMFPSANAPVGALTFTATSSDETVVMAEVSLSTITLTPMSRGTATVTVTASDVRGVSVSQEFEYTTAGIEITTQPSHVDAAVGSDVTLTVAGAADFTLSYQWYRQRTSESESTALSGETNATLTLSSVSADDMGFYWAEITGGDATVLSDIAIVTLTGGISRLANLSARGFAPGNEALTPGFVLRGSGSKELVIRGVGPTLGDFGVATAMEDSTLDLVPLGESAPILSNDNWGDSANAAELAATSAAVGAFPLPDGSLDAAVLTSVSLGDSTAYTVQISEKNGAGGVALAEIYDPEAIGSGAELSNISARGFSGPGIAALTPGFVIDGTGAKTMLIRVVGPSLGDFGVSDFMLDPRLELVSGGQTVVIAANDNWGGTAELKAAFATAGAFSLSSDDSLDAAVLVRLPPGAYTVRPSGANEGIGVILVEAYEVLE